MSYKCKKCNFSTSSRKKIREHARSVHRIKGKPLAPPQVKNKYELSEISESYERVI